MKLKELIIVIGIVIVLIGVIFIVKNNNEKIDGGQQTSTTQTTENKEEYVEVKTDGTKVNTSEQLKKTKKVEGLEISNIQLVENGNLSRITADVKNPTTKTIGDFDIQIVVLNKEGKEIATIGGYIDKVVAGGTVKLDTAATVDFANAYDFNIIKK